MSPILRLAIRLLVIIVVVGFVIQPYNWYCLLTQSCRPFFLSYYMPKSEGKKDFEVEFSTSTYKENLQFFAEEAVIITPTNRKHVATFHIKNLSKKMMVLRPKLIVEPKEVEKYIVRYQCPCLQQYKLKGLEEKTMVMEFEIDKKFETDDYQLFKQIIEHPVKIQLKI